MNDVEELVLDDAPPPPAPPAPNRRRMIAVRATLAIFVLAFIGFVLALASQVPPTDDSIYPKCYSYRVGGIHCPGCGLTRAVFSLTHGEIAQAFAYNPLIALFSPYLLFMALRSTWFWVWGTKARRSLFPSRASWPVFFVLIAYWILRNVPYYPFTLLAPHELSQ